MKDRVNILVVDDEPVVHAVLVEHLERWGDEAVSASRYRRIPAGILPEGLRAAELSKRQHDDAE